MVVVIQCKNNFNYAELIAEWINKIKIEFELYRINCLVLYSFSSGVNVQVVSNAFSKMKIM